MSPAKPKASDAIPMRAIELSLPMQLLKAREAAMLRFRPMLREHGLTEQQWRVIRALADVGAMGAGELARHSILLAPSLTRILKHLEHEKLVRRSDDARDQRRATFRLTARGERLFEAAAPDAEAIYAGIEANFGRDRLQQLNALLDELSDALGSADE